jgi:hypothetical protein
LTPGAFNERRDLIGEQPDVRGVQHCAAAGNETRDAIRGTQAEPAQGVREPRDPRAELRVRESDGRVAVARNDWGRSRLPDRRLGHFRAGRFIIAKKDS